MGAGRWDPTAYSNFTTSTDSCTTDEIYSKRALAASLDPKGVAVRESRDSEFNPESNAIIVGIDVTGSMGILADTIARKGLGTLFQEILDRKPVSDPHLMFMAIGDVAYDSSPLQVSQFEADDKIIGQLTDIHIEHGGGGNSTESYNFPWYFAALHTSIDCMEKRGRKGYLFTIGDEETPNPLSPADINKVLGYTPEASMSNEDLLELVGRSYHVFHLMVEEGSHMRTHHDRVVSKWTTLLGQRAIRLSDHTKLSEVIVSLIQVTEGTDAATVAASWSGDTSLVVGKAVKDLTTGAGGTDAVVRL